MSPQAANPGRWAAIVAAALVMAGLAAGCASGPVAPPTVIEAVPEAPCRVNLPARPLFPADTLTGSEDLWTIGTTLWADRSARRGYERSLEEAVRGCAER